MNNLYIIKERLLEAMRVRGMNATELASKSGLAKSSVSRYLSGENIPRSIAIGKMAKALNVSPAWILGYNLTMEGEEIKNVELEKLTPENQTRLFAYYQALLDSQGDEYGNTNI
jgi:transcriptional regulator with XRE-family HTH domain